MKYTYRLLLFVAMLLTLMSSNVAASGEDYDSDEARLARIEKHRSEHRNDYHVELVTYHHHGGRGGYDHRHSRHDLDVPLELKEMKTKPSKDNDGVIWLNNIYCPVTGDMVNKDHSVLVDDVMYNVACANSTESIRNNMEKYQSLRQEVGSRVQRLRS